MDPLQKVEGKFVPQVKACLFFRNDDSGADSRCGRNALRATDGVRRFDQVVGLESMRGQHVCSFGIKACLKRHECQRECTVSFAGQRHSRRVDLGRGAESSEREQR